MATSPAAPHQVQDQAFGIQEGFTNHTIQWPVNPFCQRYLKALFGGHAEIPEEWSSIQTLLLAVEVVSPGSARYDRIVKRQVYQEHGVATYWIVDLDARVVEVWCPDDERPEIVTDVLRWRVGAEADESAIELAEIFKVPG